MRILFALAGLHRYDRGAEIAFKSLASELSTFGDDVTVIGSGEFRSHLPYTFLPAASVDRKKFERWPNFPGFRDETAYEEMIFAASLLQRYNPSDYDVTLTCAYPFTNWALRRPTIRIRRPPHIFVTQNGDWPAFSNNSEFRFFGCEGLVCTNPDYLERNKDKWKCALIPNGVDTDRFNPGASRREDFGLPKERHIVLMVSALIESKRVAAGIDIVSLLPNTHLVVAGDGPLRDSINAHAAASLQERFTLLTVSPDRIPDLYRAADVFLHLSKSESFGNVYLEAMATSLPIVAHDSPRTRWLLGSADFLVDTDDFPATAQVLAKALSQSSRKSSLRERALTFAWSSIAQQYRAFIQEVVSKSHLHVER